MRIAVLYSYPAQEGIVQALKDNNNQVDTFFYGSGEPTLKKRLFWKIFGYEKYYTKLFNINIKRIYAKHLENPYDAFLIIKGKKISKNCQKILLEMESVYKILWTTDSITRVPEQIAIKDYVDKVFVQDGYDVQSIKDSDWLPLGFDRDIFYNKKSKNIDILLFGNCDLKYYSERLNYFLEVSNLADRYKIVFVGSNVPDDMKEILKTKGVEVHERLMYNNFIDYICSSKVCVNIHQNDGDKAINPLFFAIPSCGAIQVSDDRNYYTDWLIPNKEYYPIKIGKINFLLLKIMNNFADYQLNEQEIKKIATTHSYHGRAKTILDSIGK